MDGVKVNGKRYALARIIEMNDKTKITLSPNQYRQTRARLKIAIDLVMKATTGSNNNIGSGTDKAFVF